MERERILTERIAEILMGYKDFTQKPQEVEEQINIKDKIIVKSQLLQQLHQAVIISIFCSTEIHFSI